MAGTVTVSPKPKVSGQGMKVERLEVAWTSDASGDATGSLTAYGWLIKVVTDPTDAPTDNYDITLLDEYGADAFQGLLMNRDTTVTESAYTFVTGSPVPVLLAGAHTFTVAAAGNAKSGVATLYLVECL